MQHRVTAQAGSLRAVAAATLCVVAALVPTGSARAALPAADPAEIAACRAIVDPVERAGCYDLLFGEPGTSVPPTAAAAPQPPAPDEPSPDAAGSAGGGTGPDRGVTGPERDAAGLARDAALRRAQPAGPTPLAIRWELDPGTNRGLWLPRAHHRTYILPAQWSDRRNDFPQSPSREPVRYDAPLEAVEAKFQLSLKLKALDDVLGTKADLWIGYTQQSYWQVYNGQMSRPFRETNYEPELFATLPVKFDLLGLRGRFVNFGFVHQSNGQSDPRSRSWNRLYAQVGFERGPYTVVVRPWLRLNERNDDDNPDIMDYVGRADLLATWTRGERTISLLLRNSLRDDWRGYAQLDYSFRVFGNLRGYVQVATGYGESLIDYNHRQTTIGLGVAVIDVL